MTNAQKGTRFTILLLNKIAMIIPPYVTICSKEESKLEAMSMTEAGNGSKLKKVMITLSYLHLLISKKETFSFFFHSFKLG